MPTTGSGPTHEQALELAKTEFISPTQEAPLEVLPSEFMGPTHEGPAELLPSEFMGPTQEQNLVFSEPTSSALVLGQSVFRTIEVSVIQNLALASNPGEAGIFTRDISQTIVFSQRTNQIHVLVNQSIVFAQIVVERLPIINLSPSNTIQFLDVVRDGSFRRSLSNSIAFGQALVLTQVISRSIENIFSVEQQARNTIEESVSNTIVFAGVVNTIQEPNNALVLGQILVADLARLASNTLVFGPIVVVNVDYNRALVNTLALSGVTVGKIFQLCLEAGLPAGSTILLTAAGASALTLPNPEFGNSESLSVVRALNTSRGGTINIFQDSIWPEETIINFKVNLLSETKKNEVLDFVRDSLGKLVTLADQDGRTWQGIIENPQEVSISDDGQCDQFAAEFNLTAVLT